MKEVDIGLAADIGTLTRLPKSVGSMSWIKDVTLSARVFGAEEAAAQGLVSGVYATKEEAIAAGLEKARLIASKSPVAVLGTKELVNWSRDRPTEDGEFFLRCFFSPNLSQVFVLLGVMFFVKGEMESEEMVANIQMTFRLEIHSSVE